MTKVFKAKKLLVQSTLTTGQDPLRPASNVKHFRLKPYRRGAFDGFCGLYSVINATCLIAHSSDGIGEDFCDSLFESLLLQGRRHFGLRRLTQYGTPQWLMRHLIRGACAFIGNHTKLTPLPLRPFLGKSRLRVDQVLQTMRGLLADQRCAFIVELGGFHSHWTVIQDVSAAQVHLFDSAGLKVLNTKDIRMSYEKTKHHPRHWLVHGSIFMLKRS
jgi:hypothetical protein